MTTTIDLDAVVAALDALGIDAHVEQTGGGTATLFAGPTHLDDAGDPRFAACAGPGWFAGASGIDGPAVADLAEFYIGPADPESFDNDTVEPNTTDPTALADIIADVVARHHPTTR
jgi:hypothetical protein